MRQWLCIFGLALSVTPAWAQDLRYPPTVAEKSALLAMSRQEARDVLAAKLEEGYLPGLAGRAGSTGMTGYRQWLALWKWFDLLSRTETDEATALIQRHLFLRDGHDQPIFVPPGRAVEPGDSPLPLEACQTLLSNPKIRAEILGELLPPGIPTPREAPVAERFDKAQLDTWILDANLTDLLFSTLTSDDYSPGVLWNLKDIQDAHPQALKDYPALAVAIAVVYDSKLPRHWPHHQVSPELVPLAEVTPATWFARWVDAAEKRDLLIDLKTAKPGHLKFLVDAPLSESEYAWAQKEARFPRSDFAKAFSAVKYNQSRISSQDFVWTIGDYSMANILHRGGICVDQAYFAVIAGKARGIPTLFFTGQGSDGGHAWFGYLKTNERWELEAGRYENQNYAVGEAWDPQNWRPINDHELAALADGFREKATYAASRDDLLMAALFEKRGNPILAAKAYESAVAVCPQLPDAWEARSAYLERTQAPTSVRKAFHESALKQFQTQRDLRVRHQAALAAIAREEGDITTAETIEKQIVTNNRRTRSDLSINAAARRLTTLLENKKTSEALSEYRKLLTSLKKTGGGNFFYEIVVPFANALKDEGETTHAIEAVQLAQKALNPEAGSILDQEFGTLLKDLSVKSTE